MPTGTLELYNEGHQRELIVVWDTATSVYRIATEQEKADPNVGTLSAPKWGSYLNKDADSKDSPSCLIDLKALKQTVNHQNFDSFNNFTVSVQPTTLPQVNTYYQDQEETKSETSEGVDIDAWALSTMMKFEMSHENNYDLSEPAPTTDDTHEQG